MVIGGCSGHRYHEAIMFTSGGNRKRVRKTSALVMRRADLRLLRELLNDVLWENAFKGAGIHQCWPLFKPHILKAQEQGISECQKQTRQKAGLHEQASSEAKARK